MERISSRQNPIVKRFREAARAGGGEWCCSTASTSSRRRWPRRAHRRRGVRRRRCADGRLAALAARLVRAGSTRDRRHRSGARRDEPGASARRASSRSPRAAGRRRRSLMAARDGRRRWCLMLSEVQDPGNVGAIVRAAEACGATGVVAGEGTADPFGWKALRGAMGSTFRLPVASRQTLADAVGVARAQRGCACSRRRRATARRCRRCDLRGPSAILLGGEGAGLPPAICWTRPTSGSRSRCGRRSSR